MAPVFGPPGRGSGVRGLYRRHQPAGFVPRITLPYAPHFQTEPLGLGFGSPEILPTLGALVFPAGHLWTVCFNQDL